MDVSQLSLDQIRLLLRKGEEPDLTLLRALAKDRRLGARNLALQWTRILERDAAEAERVHQMFRHELDLSRQGYETVAGTDEVGRGPLAGPVVAAAVILPIPCYIPDLRDSKLLPPVRRKSVAEQVTSLALGWGIGLATVDEINQTNILQASLAAMRRAVGVMGIRPDWLLVDGNRPIEGLGLPQTCMVKGDALSASVAAASVLAKEFRDWLMSACDFEFPQYGFSTHKGYATKGHYQALERFGPCSLHRRAFLPEPRLFGDGAW